MAAEQQGERLQKYLARAGVASRRHAEELIAAGRVSVNGETVRLPGTRVDPARDVVAVDGQQARPAETLTWVLLNKPAATVTTVSDPQGRRTVLDLLPDTLRAQRLFPVGRLDWDTEGLLLLTNDGDLALRLTHPRYALPKEYEAMVRGMPSHEALARLRRGVWLPGETRLTAPAVVRVLGTREGDTLLALQIHEGRNRQVRRMFETVGHQVVWLRRVRLGPLSLGALSTGAWRLLTADEVAALRRATGGQ